VNIFGGEVAVKSEPNIGSTFTFSFELEELKSQVTTIQRILNPRAITAKPTIAIIEHDEGEDCNLSPLSPIKNKITIPRSMTQQELCFPDKSFGIDFTSSKNDKSSEILEATPKSDRLSSI